LRATHVPDLDRDGFGTNVGIVAKALDVWAPILGSMVETDGGRHAGLVE